MRLLWFATLLLIGSTGCNKWDVRDAALDRCISYTTDAYVEAAIRVDDIESGRHPTPDKAGAIRRLEVAKTYTSRWCSEGGTDAIAEMIAPCTEYPFKSDSALLCIERRAPNASLHPLFFGGVSDLIAAEGKPGSK